ncbi:two component transcriptional regulator, LytTR family [Chishuiella changwenlii]|uniref:DNA-binding response regulator n=1 Tax=Chishuiella changwenlii TaxID=1434701 RepID=A0A1M7BCE0_9FLAO|nr:LytTR family DNA-binding domain-containing protein [Chishuiella changwenlii]GGE96492.1 DNA-binding response regulator [Chishuiella changwenlii]SHL52705.1 two component transcriptional regulator, LytTR family [Chishuiella changwenlii]
MEKIRCIILDDEPIGREILQNFTEKIPFLEVCNTFESPLDVITYLQENEIDLLITDINMPHLNGVELVQSLQKPPFIIFVTAHRDFALDGFDSGAVDYLVKPVRFERFLKAVNKVSLYKKDTQKDKTLDTKTNIFLKVNGKFEKIILDTILYIEANGDYLKIVTEKQNYTILSTMKSFEESLDSSNFLRVQRSFIININSIQSFSGNTVQLNNGKTISISIQKKEELFKILGV